MVTLTREADQENSEENIDKRGRLREIIKGILTRVANQEK